MKRLACIFAIVLAFLACQQKVEKSHDVPLQLTYAEQLIDEGNNMAFALFLLDELEDSIDMMSDSIQTRYHVARSIAFTLYELNVDDSVLETNLVKEMQSINKQTRSFHQRNTQEAHTRQLIFYGILGFLILVSLVFGYLYWRKARKTSALQQQVEQTQAEPAPLFQKMEDTFEQIADVGRCPNVEEWEQMHCYLCSTYPLLTPFLEEHQDTLSTTELRLCLLTCTSIRQKQVATLLGVSQQNLRNIKVRLCAKLTGNECSSVQVFSEFMEKVIKGASPEEAV